MNSEKIVDLIKNQFYKNSETFFTYAWREKIETFLAEESKFVKLVYWIDGEIGQNQELINAFNPADKYESYQIAFFNTYKTACMNLAMLLNFKDILLDKRTTTEMRENIEYTICKEFKIKYVKGLNCYQ